MRRTCPEVRRSKWTSGSGKYGQKRAKDPQKLNEDDEKRLNVERN
jgi:hypothetical protein